MCRRTWPPLYVRTLAQFAPERLKQILAISIVRVNRQAVDRALHPPPLLTVGGPSSGRGELERRIGCAHQVELIGEAATG